MVIENKIPEVVEEEVQHIDAVRKLTIEAFATSELGHNGEADLVDAIRESCPDALSLVAVENDEVVGHILFSPSRIVKGSSEFSGMGLAPMSVLPSRQRCGIGSLLVEEGLRCLSRMRARFALVLGHPDYYPRFGFLPAAEYSVTHGFAGIPQDLLFIQVFDDSLSSQLSGGRALFHPTFGAQDKAV